jgi:UDP-glucose 4-epimerase
MNNRKVVVTGGAGFIGSHLARELIQLGTDVHIVDDLSFGSKSRIPNGATFHQLDIRDERKLGEAFRDAFAVFHLAAIASVPLSLEDPMRVCSVNSYGTVAVLHCAHRNGVRRVVYSASSAAYGERGEPVLREDMPAEPLSPYGLSKYEGELAATVFRRAYGLQTVSLRYFNVYGPGQNPDGPYAAAIARFVAAKKAGRPLQVVGDGEQTRDFVMVNDVVRANIAAATSPRVGSGEVINIGTGQGVRIIDVATMIGGAIEFIPPRPEIRHSRADISLARRLLDFEATVSLSDGLSRMMT